MPYRVEFTKRAVKQLAKVSVPFYGQIKLAIQTLRENPRSAGCKKLKGVPGYRIRVGDYRVIYEIADEILLVQVIKVGNRNNVYE